MLGYRWLGEFDYPDQLALGFAAGDKSFHNAVPGRIANALAKLLNLIA
jgi:hypothetical protein